MSKNSGNLQSELTQRDQEINQLQRKIQDLERELMRVKKEKEDEIERREH